MSFGPVQPYLTPGQLDPNVAKSLIVGRVLKVHGAPATTDIRPVGFIWVDLDGDDAYICVDVTAGVATWNVMATTPGNVDTLTGDTGGAITPSAGDIGIKGTSGQVVVTGNGGAHKLTISIPNPFVVPGDLTVTGLLTVDGSALIKTGGTTLNLATDSDTAAVNLATVGARTVTIGNITTSTAVNVNSGTGGVHLVSTGSGDITAASGDTLLLDSVGVLELNSSAGVISVGNDAVSQNINVGTAGARVITIGNVTTSTGIALNSGTGGVALVSTSTGDITLASGDTVLIDGTGVVEINSSAGVISVGNDAVAQNINVGTGAAQRVITIGNVTNATAVNINSGTGGVALVSTSTGDITLTSGDTVLIDGAGVVEINSSAGVISVGNDNVNQNINVGTAGTRTIAIGSAAATQTILGAVNINATGSAITTIGTGGTGAVNIGNATGNTSVTGSLTATTTLTASLGAITATNGDVILGTAGNKLKSTSVATTTTAGANSFGTVQLSGGGAVVNTSAAKSASIILLSTQVLGTVGTPMPIAVTARVDNTSFTITSSDGTDTSTVGWMIIN